MVRIDRVKKTGRKNSFSVYYTCPVTGDLILKTVSLAPWQRLHGITPEDELLRRLAIEEAQRWQSSITTPSRTPTPKCDAALRRTGES